MKTPGRAAQPGPWYLLQSGLGESAFNVALDEALLHASPRLGQPVLRFYGWTEPAASFGYFQKHADIARMTPLRPLVRRPTGGGLVPHDADWTYSLAFPPSHEWYSLSAADSYRRVHEWIRAAFAALSIAAELAPACSKALPGQCFMGHEKHDVLCGGRKVAGAAQRRTREGLLIQGSVQPGNIKRPTSNLQHPMVPLRAAWEEAMREVAHADQHAQWEDLVPDGALVEHACLLARQKYSQTTFNQKR